MTISTALASFVNTATLGHLKAGWFSAPYRSRASAIFSGGSPRSGTTLMYSLLNAHSRIAIGLETGLLTGSRNIAGVAYRTRLPEVQIRKLYRKSCCFPAFTEKVLSALAERDGKSIWGDKSPVNVTLIDTLFRHFPESRFIHVIRDGRDVACSLRNYPRTFGNRYEINPWDLCIGCWIEWTRKGLAFRGHPAYYEVKYEELITSPESTLRAMFHWLGEPWEPEILNKCRLAEVSTHPELSQPINRSRVGRWQEDLPPEARQLFRESGAELLVKLGYEKDHAWIGGS